MTATQKPPTASLFELEAAAELHGSRDALRAFDVKLAAAVGPLRMMKRDDLVREAERLAEFRRIISARLDVLIGRVHGHTAEGTP